MPSSVLACPFLVPVSQAQRKKEAEGETNCIGPCVLLPNITWRAAAGQARSKVGGRRMIRESELQKVIEDGGKSPAPKRRET
jgi:hypothetical protein